MSRPLERLVDLGIARREIPFGEPEKKCRRSLYKLDDPFFRLWFRLVAPHRAQLASSTKTARIKLLTRYWDGLVADGWEDLWRSKIPSLQDRKQRGDFGSWGPAARWWKGNLPEWDIVAEAVEGKTLLLGEVKWTARPVGQKALRRLTESIASKVPPQLGSRYAGHDIVRMLFVPDIGKGTPRTLNGVKIVTGSDL